MRATCVHSGYPDKRPSAHACGASSPIHYISVPAYVVKMFPYPQSCLTVYVVPSGHTASERRARAGGGVERCGSTSGQTKEVL